LTYRHAVLSDQDARRVIAMRANVPEFYHPTHPRIVGTIPFQIARFRGDSGRSSLEVYGRIPLTALGSPDSIQIGFFGFELSPWRAVVAGRRTVRRTDAVERAHYQASLAPGRYLLSVEALGNDTAATGRDTVAIRGADTTLAMSDLLLADQVTGPSGAHVRAQLAIEGSPTLTFQRGTSIALIWEVYNLALDSSNVGHYHVRLELRDVRGGLVRALRSLTLQGNSAQTSLEWDSERGLNRQEPALEYTTISLPGASEGRLRLTVTVTDHLTGLTTSGMREFSITTPIR
jgi:hypothetical protein